MSEYPVQNVEQTVQRALDEHPDIRIVLNVAARARDMEAKEPPRDFATSTEVVAIPSNLQHPV